LSNLEGYKGMADALSKAVQSGAEARQWLLDNAGANHNEMGAASVNFLMLLGYVCGGWILAMSTIKATALLEAGGDEAFLDSKQKTARFYFEHLLPRTHSHLASIVAGSDSIMALDVEQF
jgi:hypothetical protein